MLKRFNENDIFVNTMKTHPEFSFFIYDGTIYINDRHVGSNITNNKIELYELSGISGITRFIPKGANLTSFKTTTSASFSSGNYGDVFSKTLPYTASITPLYYDINSADIRLKALKNAQRQYVMHSNVFSSSFENKNLMLIDIPSIFYGSSIKKKSVYMDFFITGTLAGRLNDIHGNGELIEVTGSNSGSVAGIVLYNEGVILLTGSWSLDTTNSEDYVGAGSDEPRWKYWGATSSNIDNSSFNINYKGTQEINVLTMFANANVGELNHSNNPTYKIFSASGSYASTGSNQYIENENLIIKNTATSSYSDAPGLFIKQTYISSIQIFDEEKRLIGVAKLASPIRKRERDSLSFKMTLDI